MNDYIKPEYNKSAVITIDTQRDTLDGQPLEITGTSVILPKMKQLLDCYPANKRPIVHIVRIYHRDRSNADICRKHAIESGAPMLLENSLGAELASELFDSDSIRYDTDLLLKGDIQPGLCIRNRRETKNSNKINGSRKIMSTSHSGSMASEHCRASH